MRVKQSAHTRPSLIPRKRMLRPAGPGSSARVVAFEVENGAAVAPALRTYSRAILDSLQQEADVLDSLFWEAGVVLDSSSCVGVYSPNFCTDAAFSAPHKRHLLQPVPVKIMPE